MIFIDIRGSLRISSQLLKLLLLTSFSSTFFLQSSISSANTVYVDRAAGETGDGTASDPYSAITTAIILACPGDTTLIVKSGAYPENVVINNPVTIEASGGSVLIGSSNVDINYTSYPLISESGITDIHEGSLNGPEGFAYFKSAPTEKTGNLPVCLGGETGWDTDVWASNFQGPIPLSEESARIQWEWTADGSPQISVRDYPAIYGNVTTTRLSDLESRAYDIYEHDEGGLLNPWSGNDYIGTITLDHGYCKSEVFDLGLTSGWTSVFEQTREGKPSASRDVEYVRYRLFCFRSGY